MSEPFEVSDEDLLKRVMRNLDAGRDHQPRWVAVMETFAVGSTYARLICDRFNMDPYEALV